MSRIPSEPVAAKYKSLDRWLPPTRLFKKIRLGHCFGFGTPANF